MTFMAITVEGTKLVKLNKVRANVSSAQNQPFSDREIPLKESRGSTPFYQQLAELMCFDITASLFLLYLS